MQKDKFILNDKLMKKLSNKSLERDAQTARAPQFNRYIY